MLGRRPPVKGRTAAERKGFAREADRTYRAKQKAMGVPSTREFADFLAYEILRSNKTDTAAQIAQRCCGRMLAYRDPKSGKQWTKAGIRARHQYLSTQISRAIAAEEAERIAKEEAEKTAA